MGFLAFALLLPEASRLVAARNLEGLGLLVRAISRAWWKHASASRSSQDTLQRSSPLERCISGS